MQKETGFYTLKGYQLGEVHDLTTAMEDYLEMIFRLQEEKKEVRMHELAAGLNVRASSASKMVNLLKEKGYVEFERYGRIFLKEKGKEEGRYLLYRHEIIHEFLCLLNKSQNELEQAEKIEHFFNRDTVHNLEGLVQKMKGKV